MIIGGGSIPIAVAEAVERRGRRVVLFPMRGWADPAVVKRFRHYWLGLVQTGRFVRHARAEGCRDVVFVGTAVRPPLHSLRIDWVTVRLLPRIMRSYRGGDDHLHLRRCKHFRGLWISRRRPARGGAGDRDARGTGRKPLALGGRSCGHRAGARAAAGNRTVRHGAGGGRRRQSRARRGGRGRNRRDARAYRRIARTGAHRDAARHRRAGEGAEAATGPPLRFAGDRSAHRRGSRARRASGHRSRRGRHHHRRAGCGRARRPTRRRSS